jgi:hypothetical protein
MKYYLTISALVFGPITASGMVHDLQSHHSAAFNAGLTMFWLTYSITVVLPSWIVDHARKR